ncbi:NADH-quinone oxidoreductase subunit G [Kineothrix alysoides]|uniref:NADH-quinone oxidoreductase subunit G n=1 Tax=Kineothrix alysoides TaxID=1469948 RepID=A0A4R1R4C4_9FIRM|nr:[FeFe] hydrogenase, group A [Kineothrix alysoides]TCL60314.1 NADH-quinone oxidoreductase subunit G [Kineothrix alysoides]
MVNLKIDNRNICIEEGTTIMKAAAHAGIMIPHLCYLEGINEISACKVCVVEMQGKEKLITSCNNAVEEGMVIYTNSPKVRAVRSINVELVLSQHDCHCATCVRSGNCNLQKMANDLGLTEISYPKVVEDAPWNQDYPLIRDFKKCIKCMRCVQVCDKVQDLHIWDVQNTGSRTTVDVSGHRNIEDTDCSMCGQCISHCPTGALRERNDIPKVFDVLADPEKITIVQVAPAVRTAWGESLGLAEDVATEKRMAAALKQVGFDYVFDTNFAADLTIMEEANELLKRMPEIKESGLPMFTSCCPAWVRFMNSQYPQAAGRLSTAKSPQQMFGAVAKTYFAQKLNISPDKICCISVMPCVAKKGEAAIPAMDVTGTGPDVDIVLTTRELVRLITAEHIKPELLDEVEFDSPLSENTGAGVLFGTTGGVMEAALRTAVFALTGSNPDPVGFSEVRGGKGRKDADYYVDGTMVRTCTVSGLKNARLLMDDILEKRAEYDFVEVMACPGGCVGGGGQPIWEDVKMAPQRSAKLYELDEERSLRYSHENPTIQQLYAEFLGEPLSEKSHHLLHINE